MITKSLGELSTKISSGITPLRDNSVFWADGNIPWLKTNQLGQKYIFDTDEKISSTALRETSIKINPVNTLSIAMYGEGKTRGNVSILRKPMATNQACCNVILNSELADHEYVYYCLKTKYKELRNLSSGVRKNLNSGDIKNFEIRMPEMVCDQKRIAAVLSALDAKIELNNRINAELESMAKTLYDYWFVQFDFPFDFEKGKPDPSGNPYKSSGGKMVYNKILKREIPVGWEDQSLSCHLNCNKNSLKTKHGLDYIQYLDTSSLTNNIIEQMQFLKFTQDKVPSRAQRCIKANDILFSTVRPKQRHFGIIKEPVENMIGSTGFTILASKIDSSYNDMFYRFITCEANLRYLEKIGDTAVSAYPSISPSDITALKIALPVQIDSIRDLCSRFGFIHSLMDNNQKKNQQLSQLRDWLLPMLMNGQVSVG